MAFLLILVLCLQLIVAAMTVSAWKRNGKQLTEFMRQTDDRYRKRSQGNREVTALMDALNAARARQQAARLDADEIVRRMEVKDANDDMEVD